MNHTPRLSPSHGESPYYRPFPFNTQPDILWITKPGDGFYYTKKDLMALNAFLKLNLKFVPSLYTHQTVKNNEIIIHDSPVWRICCLMDPWIWPWWLWSLFCHGNTLLSPTLKASWCSRFYGRWFISQKQEEMTLCLIVMRGEIKQEIRGSFLYWIREVVTHIF